MNNIEFTVNIKPMGAVRTTRRGKYVNKYAKKYRDYKQIIAMHARNAMRKNNWNIIQEGVPIKAEITAVFKPPKSYTKKRLREIQKLSNAHIVKPDTDNVFKGATDACNGICYKDDRQINEIYTIKRYGEHDQLVIRFIPLEAIDT